MTKSLLSIETRGLVTIRDNNDFCGSFSLCYRHGLFKLCIDISLLLLPI
jgi:hypothetical protein